MSDLLQIQTANPVTSYGELQYVTQFAIDQVGKVRVREPSTMSPALPQKFNVYGNSYFSGNVGVGTDNPYYKLDVNGTMRAKEVRVNANTGADFVFEPGYKLKPLNEVHRFVKENKHLPEIPTAAEMTTEGIDMGELQVKLLQKIEELTLYVIQQNEEIQTLKSELKELKAE